MKHGIYVSSIIVIFLAVIRSHAAVLDWGSPEGFPARPVSNRMLAVVCVASADPAPCHLSPSYGMTLCRSVAEGFAGKFEAGNGGWDVVLFPPLLYGDPGPSASLHPASSPSALYETLVDTLRAIHNSGCDDVVVIDYRFRSDSQTAVRQALRYARRTWGIRAIQPLASVLFSDGFRKDFAASAGDPSLEDILENDVFGGFVDTSLLLAVSPGSVDRGAMTNLPPLPMSAGALEAKLSLGAALADFGATNGYVGYPNLASADYGAKLLELLTAGIAEDAVRMVAGDKQIFRQTRSIYNSMPMQGDRFVFAYPMPIGSGYDGLIPAVQVSAQSGGNLGFIGLYGWGWKSGRFIMQNRLVVGDVFYNSLEAALGADSIGGIFSLYGELRFYLGYCDPNLNKRPFAKFAVAFFNQTLTPQTNYGIYLDSGTYNSIVLRFDYDPLYAYSFAFRETDTVLHDPFYFTLKYKISDGSFGGRDFDFLQCDTRFYLYAAHRALELVCRTYFAGDDIAYADGTAHIPDQEKIEGNSYVNFRGYSSLADNHFEKILVQNLELRWDLPLPDAWIFDRYLVGAGLDYGFGANLWSSLFSADSFHADVNLSLFVKVNFLPFPFYANGGMAIAGPDAFHDFGAHVGVNFAF